METISRSRPTRRTERERPQEQPAAEDLVRQREQVLGELREDFNAEATARVRLGEVSRRLVAYALVAPGESPVVALASARRYAEREGHQMVREVADATGPLDPCRRPGYLEARRLVMGGYAEGLVVRAMCDISAEPDEYEREIRDLGERCALVLLARPETQA
ncbi:MULTISPECIES: hypothetical protein [Streptomyces]|uniref:hypothetical protein n=1 Tax=Streptomyces TaxID=1883 RepID=UPI00226D57FA|nr:MULTISPECIES: hypothetical protein [unclassified Streptomyces]MCY0940181.1 hypothetical protein [Streptomyces sp. H34-AA3]MCZ4080828.1 hypothetical protein [Streptomyces sp. H34-S5]